MKILKKTLGMLAFASLVLASAGIFSSCSEEEGERCLDCEKMVRERVGFDKTKLQVLTVAENVKDFRYYYNGSYFFTNIFKDDTINYFIANPEMISEYKADSNYSFTANIYNTTDVLLKNNYNGHQYYYEIEILEIGTVNSWVNGWEFNPLTNQGGSSSGSTGGSTGGGTTGGGTTGGGTGGGTTGGDDNPGGGGTTPGGGGGGLNPGGGGLNPGGGGTNPFGK